MTLDERNEAIAEIFQDCSKILESKGRDYSGEEDAYRNFSKVASSLGLPPRQVLLVYLSKHLDAIFNAVKENPYTPKRVAESFEQSCLDAINYLAILAAWPHPKTDKERI